MSKVRWPTPAQTTAQNLLGSRLFSLAFVPVAGGPAILPIQGRAQPTLEVRRNDSRPVAVIFVPEPPPATRPLRTPGKQPPFGVLPDSRLKQEQPDADVGVARRSGGRKSPRRGAHTVST